MVAWRQKFRRWILGLVVILSMAGPLIAPLSARAMTQCDIQSLIYQHAGYDNCGPLTLAACGATVSVTLNGNDNIQRAFNFFVQQAGFTPEQSAGLVGNFYQESSVVPTTTNSKGYHGIAQWDPNPGGRLEGLIKFAAEHPDLGGEDSLATQLAYVVYELNNTRKQAGDDLKKQTTVAGAANSVFLYYEGPGDNTEPKRAGYAQQIFSQYASVPGTNPVATQGSSSSGLSECAGVSSAGQNSQFFGNFTVYSQYDPAWANKPYGDTTIAVAGCGPSAMAMIITALTGSHVTPDQVAALADQLGLYVPGKGSSWSLPVATAPHWGLKATPLGASIPKISAAVQAGGLVILSGQGPVPFTTGGHYIVIRAVTATGKWLIGDSGHNDTSGKEWDPQQLLVSMNAGSVYAITK